MISKKDTNAQNILKKIQRKRFHIQKGHIGQKNIELAQMETNNNLIKLKTGQSTNDSEENEGIKFIIIIYNLYL